MKTKIKAVPNKPGALGRALTGVLLASMLLAAPAQAQAEDRPPPHGAVLGAIHNVPVDADKDTLELDNGVVATFWYGREFDLAGKHYYTAFVWHTRDREARKNEDFVAPDVQVRLAQVTFERTDPGKTPAYSFTYLEHKIGFMGGSEQPEEVDSSRPPLEYRTADSRLVLAVPTETFDSGVSIKGYSLFVFNPNPRSYADGGVWAYLGPVFTGEDNSAACDDGTVMPCIGSDGELSFVPGDGPMPLVQVKLSGTTIDGPDKTRALGDADSTRYRFDGNKWQYVKQ